MGIEKRAMLVSLHISWWNAKKKDNSATRKIIDDNGAEHGSAVVVKELLAKCDLKPVASFAGGVRNWFYSQTLPWGQEGQRIMPSDMFFDFSEAMKRKIREFDILADNLMLKYDSLVASSANRLGLMFNSSEYPSSSRIRSKFGISVNYSPLPLAEDFRIDLGNEALARIQQDYREAAESMLKSAQNELWTRLYTVTSHMAQSLQTPDKIFRDSLVGNVLDLCKILPKLNVAKDPDLEAARQSIEKLVTGISPQQLRDDKTLRAKVANAVNREVQKIGDKESDAEKEVDAILKKFM